MIRPEAVVISGHGSYVPTPKEALMKSSITVLGGALAAAVLAATALTGDAAQEGSTSVKRVEPFTRLTAMRIKPLEPSKWTDAHREVIGARGVDSQQAVCAHNLELCRKFWEFTTQLTSHYTLPLRDKELLILRTAWLSRGDFVWGAHSTGSGKKAGITDEELTRITKGPDAKGWNNFDRALLRAADELHTSRFIKDATWKTLDERYDEGQLVEVLFVVGDYTLLTMFQNSVGLPLRPGVKGLPD
jgi:4-carboxymuconolactone decarboxylase